MVLHSPVVTLQIIRLRLKTRRRRFSGENRQNDKPETCPDMWKANSMAAFFCCKQAIKELENTACDVWNISETSNESLQSKQTLLAMDGRFVWPWAIAGKLNWIHIDIAICISFQTQFPLIFPPIIWKLARHSYMAWGLMYILHLWFGVSERCWTMNLIWTNDT